jgi:branched-chain amino acid transport system ATP-binding protein
MSDLLAIEGLTVAYQGTITALREVDVTVAAGRVAAVVGNNGAGKSTLLRAVSQNLTRHRARVVEGDIRLNGSSLRGRSSAECVRLGVVQVPEGRRIFGSLTVEENLRLAAAGAGRQLGRLKEVYERFPVLGQRRGQRGQLLSGGEQQMLALGRALVAEPVLLMLDEPSLGLAPQVAVQVVDVIRGLAEGGVGILLVEQNAALALSIADTGYVLELGRVSLSGPGDRLQQNPDVRRLYLGASVGHA